ncbi:MAG: hypothetical protein WCE73_00145 [Candidatus Angelobacter sp.]
MPDPSDNLPAQSESHTAALGHRLARVSALAALAVVFAGVAYSGELGFMVYATLFAIPHAVFVCARSSRKWQAWGWAIGWVISAVALLLGAFTALKIMRHSQGSQIAMLLFLLALLLSQTAQLIFVRRAFPGKIAFGTPLFRVVLYYVCVLLVVGATLPNWYVPPTVRHKNKAFKSQRDSSAIEWYAATPKDPTYPSNLSDDREQVTNKQI